MDPSLLPINIVIWPNLIWCILRINHCPYLILSLETILSSGS